VNLEGVGQNADCHFINCFFDALFVETDTSGCVRIRDCFDVHIRNSFLRVNNAHKRSTTPNAEPPKVLGAAVDVAGTNTNVVIEGRSLECPRESDRLLNVGPNSNCHFKHSSTDSIMLWGFDETNRGRFHSLDIPSFNLFPATLQDLLSE